MGEHIEKSLQEAFNRFCYSVNTTKEYEKTEHEIQEWFDTCIRPVFCSEKDPRRSYLNLGFSPGSIQGWSVQVHLTKEQSFKTLTQALSELLGLGWKERMTSDVFDGMGKEYEFRKARVKTPETENLNIQDYLYVTMRVWPPADSQFCQKVKVGVQDKFELQCVGVGE